MKDKLKDSLILLEVAEGFLIMIVVLGVPLIVGGKFLSVVVEWLF